MIKKALESDGLVAARLKLSAEAKVKFLTYTTSFSDPDTVGSVP
jgi:hypothetical protein